MPAAYHRFTKAAYLFAVAGQTVVAAMPPDYPTKVPVLLLEREMPVVLAPVPYGLGSPCKSVAGRELTYDQPTSPRLAPHVGEAEEVELALSVMSAALPVHGPEVHKARLAVMEREPISRKPLAKDSEHTLAVPAVPECNDKVICVPHQPVRPNARCHVLFHPYIQHMVQEYIGENRTDDATLRRAFFGALQDAIVEHSCCQPFVDHPSDDAVVDPLVKEPPQVLVINAVERPYDTLPTSANFL